MSIARRNFSKEKIGKGMPMLAYQETRMLINGVPVGPIFGGTQPVRQEGMLTQGDLVTVTADGIDLNALWNTFSESTAIYNEAMDALIGLLTYPVTTPIEPVVQIGEVTFEEATEIGVPRGAGMPIDVFQMGYDIRHYDKRNAFTWMFLADADARQVEAIHEAVLWADKRLVFRKIMEALFDNRTRRANIRNQAYSVYPLYNGDGVAPPRFKNNVFSESHSHYQISHNSTVDSSDLEDLMEQIAEHGYSPQAGTSFLLLANKAETDAIRTFRRGVVNNNGATAGYDFIPSPTQPAMILPNAEGLLGSQPAPVFGGLAVIGSYGFWNIVEEDYIPAGYLCGVGYGGRFNLGNPVGLRQHANPDMQGLRIIAGNNQRYPLVDGFYARSFGSGVRQRGGAAIMQIKASGEYDIPAQYTKGGGFLV
jgi:hypothetical protein